MTPKGRLAIGAAEQAGRVLGARAAHSALRSLVLTLSHPDDRVAALLAAARHALQLADEPAVLALATLHAEIHDADARAHLPALTQLCARLLAERRPRVAVELARAELRRAPSGEAHYLLGRCLHRQHPAEADTAYRAAESAPGEALQQAAHHQRRLLALARRAPAPARAASGATPPAAPEEARHGLSDAAARLTHGGRYARALAIDQLASLAQEPALERALQQTALRLLARHADERGTDLSEVEGERLRVALAPFGAPLAEALAARSRAPQDPPEASLAPSRAPSEADAIATQLTGGALNDAVRTLRHARTHSAHEDAPSSLYAAGWLAALSDDAEVALEGSLLLDSLLRESTRAPRRGFLPLASALRPKYPALAAMARERAAERREPGAAEALVRVLVEEAFGAYAQGDRAAALRALRRADRLDAEATPAPPPRRTTP
jgi:hypothetical protein